MNIPLIRSDHLLDHAPNVQQNYIVIARDLHDEIGQELTALKLIAQQLTISSDISSMHDYALQINSTIDQTQGSFRKLLRRIRQMSPPSFHTKEDIHDLIKKWQSLNRFTVYFSEQGSIKQLPPPYIDALYHLIQESLTNISRHAKAKTATINLMVEDEQILLLVSDDGVGFPSFKQSPDRKFGITGMKERVADLGGTIRCFSDEGAHIHIQFSL